MRDMAKNAGMYPGPNIAVEVCVSAWSDTTKEMMANKDTTKAEIMELATIAYCSRMPKLSTRTDVTDFIACVAYAMSVNIMPGAEGTRPIYAAQFAQTTFPPRKQSKKAPKSALKADKNALKEQPFPVPTPDIAIA